MNNLTQLKLVSGEELICEIIGKNIFTGKIKIKKALMFIKRIHPDSGASFYAFAPYMTQQNHNDDIVKLNVKSIMSYCKPARLTAATYYKYMTSEHDAAIVRESMTDDIIHKMNNQQPIVEENVSENTVNKNKLH